MNAIHKVGFWSGIAAFAATLGYGVVQILQLYDFLPYPMDERLIYGMSLCIVIPLLIEILALHHVTPTIKQFWSHLMLIFTVIYAIFVTSNYVVQLATVIPTTLKGHLDEVRILQQTPHSMFWNFDAIGYISMGFATLAGIPLFKKNGSQKWARAALIAHGVVTPLIAIVYFFPDYSYKLLLLGLPWIVTAPAFMLMIAIYLRKTDKRSTTKSNEPPGIRKPENF